MKPILSIVIANYNYGRYLPHAIESILRQCDAPTSDASGRVVLPIRGVNAAVELIVCDAASKDDSVDVIKRYESCLAWWCSEKDGGQSEAFNKGFAHAKGEYLTWLNADEEYLPGTFVALYKKVQRSRNARWITGNLLEFMEDDRRIRRVSWGPHFQPFFLRGNHMCIDVFGPSSFIRRDLYDEIGPINEKFHYSMDLEYWARITLAGVPQTRLNHVCWAFMVQENSKSAGDISEYDFQHGTAENNYRSEVLGHTYKVGFRNPWYCLWMLTRVLDGSLFVRAWKRHIMIGKCFLGCIKGGDRVVAD